MIYYFKTCCVKFNESDNYFGVNDLTLPFPILGSVYSIEIPSFSGCATLINGPIPSASLIYDAGNGSVTLYSDCSDCIENAYSCFPPPPPQPAITFIQSNECDVITVFPMTIECDSINPSTSTSNDGRVSVSITGGTPPYKYIWGGPVLGNISPAVMNLPVGSYPVTVVDYWGDFTASTICQLTSNNTPTITPTSTPTPTITPTSTSSPVLTLTPTQTITPTITPTPTNTPTPTPTSVNLDCYYYNVTISGTDLAASTGNVTYDNNTVYINYTDCNGDVVSTPYTSAGTYPNDICADDTQSIIAVYYQNDLILITANSFVTQQGNCP